MCSCLLIREEIDLKFFTGTVVAFGFAQKIRTGEDIAGHSKRINRIKWQ